MEWAHWIGGETLRGDWDGVWLVWAWTRLSHGLGFVRLVWLVIWEARLKSCITYYVHRYNPIFETAGSQPKRLYSIQSAQSSKLFIPIPLPCTPSDESSNVPFGTPDSSKTPFCSASST